MRRIRSLACVFPLLAAAHLSAAEILVTPAGTPLADALARAESARRANPAEPVVITLAEGVHYLRGKTLVIGPGLSGAPKSPTVIRGVSGKTVLHAGHPLASLEWSAVAGMPGVWAAKLPADIPADFGQLYLAGVRQTLARHPNATAPDARFQGSESGLPGSRQGRWKSPSAVWFHAVTKNEWGSVHYRVAENGSLDGGWQLNREARPGAGMVEGPVEEIDAPGEWAVRDGYLHCKSADGAKPPSEGWSVDGAAVAFSLRGEAKKPVSHVALRGLRITGTARTFMDTREPLLLGDWCLARKAAVLLENTAGVTIAECDFAGLGGNAVLFSNRNTVGSVERCAIRDTGAGGVYFVGSPAAVRSPRFKYGEPSRSDKVDRAPGPIGDDFPQNCRVSDCYMHDLGLWEKQVAGVHISMASGIAVERNTMHRLPRAAVNINDGTWGGHRIEGNDAWDTVRETHDHGTFNSWGRDRFWQLDGTWSEVSGEKLKLVKSLVKLDAMKPNLLRGNRFDCRHGWGIDLDDGSSHYVIENNLVTAGGIKLREGFFRTVRNNLVIGDTLHPHVWYRECGDTVTSNVFGAPGYANIGADLAAGGGVVDRNLFAASTATDAARFRQHGGSGLQDLAAARKAGTDKASVCADPRFADAARGDFRLRTDSPAFALGFKSFPFEFGTRVPAFAREAAAARVAYLAAHPLAGMKATATGDLWGARVSEIDLGLRSAAGLNDENGLYLLDVPAGSPAAAFGLKPGEALLAINGTRLKGLESARAALAGLAAGSEVTLLVQNPRTQREETRRARLP